VADLVLSEKVEVSASCQSVVPWSTKDLTSLKIRQAWTLPMGSISRMIRAQSTHSPGHITDVGMGTFVDPDIAGGAANERATKSTLHSKLVTKIQIGGETTLMYKSLPIHIALIRGTTGENL